MKEFNMSGVGFEKKIDIIEHLLSNMGAKQLGAQSGYLLAGDVGTGKTSGIKEFARLMGMKLIVIEAPHLVEEHIIDIPFIVFDPAADSEQKNSFKTEAKDFEVKLAKSRLYTQVANAKKVPDAAHIKSIYDGPDDTIRIFEEFGGTKEAEPRAFAKARSQYDCILFLDEYFRQTSNAIRNMLRSILNGRIGQSEIPKNVYVVFASNLNDEGLGEILDNEDFRLIDFGTPSKDEWFAYLVSKFKKDQNVKLNTAVVSKFYQLLEDEHLSHDDADADVRVSPRRWEQLLLYISSSIPVKDEADARRLLTNVEVSFRNYQTGAKAELAGKVMSAVAELIKETSKIEVSGNSTNRPEDWRDTMEHQIEQKIKLGDHRKYIPVISGLPGSGKTKHIGELAFKMDMVPVYVDVHNLSAEDVIGIPLASSKSKLEVSFSKPALAEDIDKQIERGEDRLKRRLEAELTKTEANRRWKAFQDKKFKYIVFFDELNRTSTKVFNAIRRVMLEKEFGDDVKLPEGSVVIAAINPTSNGTVELTKHMKDVLDIIPVGISWPKFKAHLKTVPWTDATDESNVDVVVSVFENFIDRFRVKSSPNKDADPQFYLNVGATPVYVSPREYTDLLMNAVNSYDLAYAKVEKMLDAPEPDYAAVEQKLRSALHKTFAHSIAYITRVKHATEAPEFESTLQDWFLHGQIGVETAFKKHVKSISKISDIVDKAFDTQDANLFDDIEFVNYINSTEPQRFKEDLLEFLTERIKADVETGMESIRKKTHKKKTLEGEAVKFEKGEVSKLEFVVREIIHAIKVHKLSNVMVEMVLMAMRELLSKLTDELKDDDALFDVIQFNGDVHAFVKKLS